MDRLDSTPLPIEGANPERFHQALDQLGEAISRFLEMTGLTEDEFVEGILPEGDHFEDRIHEDSAG